MNGLAAAQRAYYRQLPDETYPEESKPFDPSYDTKEFIYEFAQSTKRAELWLEDQGIINSAFCAETMRDLCRAHLKWPDFIKSICPNFFEEAKQMAHEKWFRN